MNNEINWSSNPIALRRHRLWIGRQELAAGKEPNVNQENIYNMKFHPIMQGKFCSKIQIHMFHKVQCFRHFKLVQNVCFMSMEAAKKAAGYTAIDRYVKV